MKKLLTKLLIIGSLLVTSSIQADYCFPPYVGAEEIKVNPVNGFTYMNYLTISPLYGKATMKQGSVKNDGWLYGIHGNYDLINYNTFYFGAEIGYKFGDLKGKVSNIEELQINIDNLIVENKTKSKYSDLWSEFRAGFTFGGLNYTGGFVTPYLLVGYEQEKDNFVSPSPIEIKHKLTYGYFGGGLLSLLRVSNQMTIGANVKFKWMFNATQKTGGDPYIENKEISCANCFHWSLEIPVNYLVCQNMFVGLAPFYEYKNYDKHKFEWLGKEKATFHMWGGLLQLGYIF